MSGEVVGDYLPYRADHPDSGVDAASRVPIRNAASSESRHVDMSRGHEPGAVGAGTGGGLSLSIIMAAFNEERTIVQAVREVLACSFPCDIELIVVDDGSTDRTPDLLSQITDPRVRVCRHEKNRGKGAALKSAAAIATGTYVLPFDADLEYVAEDVLRLLEPVLRGRSTVVYGVRLFGYNTVYRSYRYAVGNKTLTRLANILYDACLSDLHTCLKLVPTALLRGLNLRTRGFGLDTEITAMLLRGGVRPFEVPVTYYARSHSEGKKITWRDAVACVWILVQVRFRRRPEVLTEPIGSVVLDGAVGRHHRPTAEVEPSSGQAGEEYVRVAG